MRRENLENRKFGRLTVLKNIGSHTTSGGNTMPLWVCRCDCGNIKTVMAGSLRQGKVKSCGCWLIDSAAEKGIKNAKHGGYSKFQSHEDQVRFQALKNIQERSKRRGYTSDLGVEDLPLLTDRCPVLGIKYQKGSLKDKDASPSIDRRNPNLPYLKKYKDNLVFISHRANRIKSNASIEELQKIIEYMGSLENKREFSLMDSNPGQDLKGNEAQATVVAA